MLQNGDWQRVQATGQTVMPFVSVEVASKILTASERNFLVPTLIPLVDKEDKQDQLHSPLHPSVPDLDG